MKYRLISLLVVVIFMVTSTALRGQNKPPGKSWQKLGENDSLVIESLPINSLKDDYAPIFIDGVLYFISSRKNRHTDEAELQYNENVYTSRYVDSTWSKPRKFYFFNSDDYTALAGFCSEGPQLFTYKTFGEGDLYCSVRGEKHWSPPKRMKSPVNSDYHEQSVAEANNIMIISSERPGGRGQHDLYWSVADENGQYLNFVSLDIVNTNGNEIDVSFSADGTTLYFSSNVDASTGGYDIFFTQLDSTRQWSKPQELFMNTRWFMDCDSMFFCSRSSESGDDDLYWGHIIPKFQRDTTSIQKLVIRDTLMTTVVLDTIVPIQHIDVVYQDTNFTYEVLSDTLVIDTIVPVQNTFIQILPDTLSVVDNKLVSLQKKLDSLQFVVHLAKVQVGAYRFITSIVDFKCHFQAFDTTTITVEKENTDEGVVYKYLISQDYSTLETAVIRQQEAIWQQTADINQSYYPQGKPYDAFIVCYDDSWNRIIIYFNVRTKDYRILVGDKVIFF